MDWTVKKEVKYLQEARDLAQRYRDNGDKETASLIEATASQLVILSRAVKENYRNFQEVEEIVGGNHANPS